MPESSLLPYKDLINGKMPPWVMRFVKSVGKTINHYHMIKDKDKILLSVSGGKDSLALAYALSVRKRWLPIDYTIKGFMINWTEHPASAQEKEKLSEYFDALGIELKIENQSMYPASFKGAFNCYLCSRNRRRILFTEAKDQGFSKIAMAHHLDDMVETLIINLFFRGEFSTMRPVQPFFGGKLFIIRPMIEQKESIPSRLCATWDIPAIKPVCPLDTKNIRAQVKPIVKSLAKIDKHCRSHVFKACEQYLKFCGPES